MGKINFTGENRQIAEENGWYESDYREFLLNQKADVKPRCKYSALHLRLKVPVPREIGGVMAKQASLLSLVVNYVRFDFAGGPSGADESYNPKQLLLSGIKMTRIFLRAESDITIKVTFKLAIAK